MPLSNEQAAACLKCVDKNKGQPPCREPNDVASKRHHPLLRVIDARYVEWPCYFHADWAEIAPLLIGQLPAGNSSYHKSDLHLTALPGFSEAWFAMIKKDLLQYINGRVSTNTHSPARIEAARKQGAAVVGYVVNGSRAIYDGQFALLYASHHDGRYRAWQEMLGIYASYKGLPVKLAPSQWQFDTYGGGGGPGVAAGDIVIIDPKGSHLPIRYGAWGAGLNLPWASGVSAGPNRFDTQGIILKNLSIWGTNEPKFEDFLGLFAMAGATAAAGYGWGLHDPNVGKGFDMSYFFLHPERGVSLVIPASGKTAGYTAGAGLFAGMLYLDGSDYP